MNASGIKGLCLDVYGTLVDQELANGGYASALVAQGLDDAVVSKIGEAFEPQLRELFRPFVDENLSLRSKFPRILDLFEVVFDELAADAGVSFDTHQAAENLVLALGQVDILPDARAFLEWADSRFPICLVSDGDDDMIYPALRRNGLLCWPVVTSEAFRSYKISQESPLFPTALRILGTSAEETLHIGDQLSDVYGAQRAGLQTAYVNRKGKPLDLATADVETGGLSELQEKLSLVEL